MASKCIEDPWNRVREKGVGGGEREKQLFSILIAEHPIRRKKKKNKQQQANINFCNSYKLHSREKNPWSATRPLVSNRTESFRRILICFRGYHQSYYPPDLCHCINQTFICNSISMEEIWQKLKMNRQTFGCQTIKYLSNVSNTPEMHPLKGIRFLSSHSAFIQQQEKGNN